jgi:CubicO group peptidase (beta-lactamase class C family)
MKSKKILFTAVIISLLFTFKQSVKAQTGYYSPSLVNFDVAMNNLLKNYDIPGGQLAITYKGRLVYSRGFGFDDKSTKTAVCPDNIFRIASLSKQITAITIMHLYEQGRIGLNDTVFGANGILNDSIYQTVLDPRVYGITVKHLLSHQGGMTSSSFYLKSQMLNFTPGTNALYSNVGFVFLGRVIEKITKQDYESYVRDTILAPIGIRDMRSGKSLLINRYPKEVRYYDDPSAPLVPSIFDSTVLVPRQYGGTFSMESSKACGGWIASAQDLCKLMCAVDKFSTRPDILLSSTINTMATPIHSVFGNPYALGWFINTTSNNWWHDGLLTGTMAYQARRNTEINYALLVNSSYSSGQYTALSSLAGTIIPLITSWPAIDLFDSTIVCSPTTNAVKNISQNSSLFTVYPNPSNGKFTVKFEGFQQANCKLIICNLLGKEIYTSFIKGQQTTADIDLSDFSKGIYFVKFDDGTYSYKQKISIE